ncbi:hypothetical protein E4U17_005728, partial [Claviceps sp. LM77 group G4]
MYSGTALPQAPDLAVHINSSSSEQRGLDSQKEYKYYSDSKKIPRRSLTGHPSRSLLLRTPKGAHPRAHGPLIADTGRFLLLRTPK